MERVVWLLGWAKVLTSLGTGAHTSGDFMGHTLVATRGALGLTGLSVQEAAGGWEMPIICVPTWASLGPWGSTGLEEGLTGTCPCPPRGSGLLL